VARIRKTGWGSVVAARGVETRPSGRHRYRKTLLTLLFAGGIIAAWQFLPPAFGVAEYVLPTPTEIARAGSQEHAQLLAGLRTTAVGAFGGFVVGNTAGFALAILVAASLTMSRVLLPMSIVIRSIPIIALAPFLTLLLGRGLATVITISALIVFFPTLVNGVLGLRSVEAEALDLMHVINAPRWQIFWRLRLPAALPSLFAALRIAAAACVLGALVAEWVASGSGLGYLILQSGTQFEVPLMWSAVILSTMMAALAFALVSFLDRRVVTWQSDT
jgi:NitT/TauT family transport system permease protein